MIREKYTVIVVGGGASGLMLATSLGDGKNKIAVLERGERVGRKLSATGNGQGNITNAFNAPYFSSTQAGAEKAGAIVARHSPQSLIAFFEDLGLLFETDERGRVYPAGRQASALTDALRFASAQRGVSLLTGERVERVEKCGNGFLLRVQTDGGEKEYLAETLVLCTGGKAAKNFGTDGSAYALATGFGHTVTPLCPSLVQLKTDTAKIKTLKGIRASAVTLTATWKGGKESLRGDVIFTDYGVSGDAVFRMSAFVADQTEVSLSIDFLPDFTEEKIYTALERKRARFPEQPFSELLCGIVNNQIGRAVLKCVKEGDLRGAVRLVKAFPLTVTGTLGFDYAQVTKGGVSMDEVDDNLQSKKVKGLYFAGEILDVDGRCGGYNLQWAYASAMTVSEAIQRKNRGQV